MATAAEPRPSIEDNVGQAGGLPRSPALSGGLLAAISCRGRTMNGQNPRPHSGPAGGRLPNLCSGLVPRTHRGDRRAGTQRARTSPSRGDNYLQLHLHDPRRPLRTSPRCPNPPSPEWALHALSRGGDPGERGRRRTGQQDSHARKISTPCWPTTERTGRTSSRKSPVRARLARLSVTVPPGGQVSRQEACRRNLVRRKCDGEPRSDRDPPSLNRPKGNSKPSWENCRSCSGPPWTLRLSQFSGQGNQAPACT